MFPTSFPPENWTNQLFPFWKKFKPKAASDLRAAFLCALIDARNEKKSTQKELERLSGIKQPMIARIETDNTNPRLDTILRILAPLGKTLAVVPIKKPAGN